MSTRPSSRSAALARMAFNAHMLFMTSWKPPPREPAKTKAELREMLAQAVRNTQPQTDPEPRPKVKKVRAAA